MIFENILTPLNSYAKLEENWWFPIARLHSAQRTNVTNRFTGEKLETPMCPAIFGTSNIETANNFGLLGSRRFYIAVKELVIEWDDYQAEVSGCIRCLACEDLVPDSHFLSHYYRTDKSLHENHIDTNQLLRFVKQPGLKTTYIKKDKEELDFYRLDLGKCKIATEIKKSNGTTIRENNLECELRSLWNQNEKLPIKHAHMTVEIVVK